MDTGYLLLEAEPAAELLADLLSALEAGPPQPARAPGRSGLRPGGDRRPQTKLDPARVAGYFRPT